MKKTFFTILILSVAIISNAQVFVGGSVGFQTQSGKTTTASGTTSIENKNNSINSFNFAPMVGYSLNNKVAVGLQLAFATTSDNDNATPTNTVATTNMWGVSPFVRYYFFNYNKLSVYGQANLTVGGGSSKAKTGNVTNDGPAFSLIGLNVAPAVQYNFTDRVGLFANLNFMNLGYNMVKTTTKTTLAGTEIKTVKDANNFNFGIDTDNALNTNNFQIGFYVNL